MTVKKREPTNLEFKDIKISLSRQPSAAQFEFPVLDRAVPSWMIFGPSRFVAPISGPRRDTQGSIDPTGLGQ
jgi:hypothetical protein